MTPNVGLIFQGGGGGLLEMGFKGAMSAGELPRWGYANYFQLSKFYCFYRVAFSVNYFSGYVRSRSLNFFGKKKSVKTILPL